MTPLYIDHPSAEPKYLNINMSHEISKDIKFGFMHYIADTKGSAAVFLFQMIVLIGGVFNSIVFPILFTLSSVVSGGSEFASV